MNINADLKAKTIELSKKLENTTGINGVAYGLPSFSRDEQDLGIIIYVVTKKDENDMIDKFGDEYCGWPLYTLTIGIVSPAGV